MNIHIVSHTHWDREWYRTFQYFNIKLSYLFDELFNILDNNPDYKHFMLDGQMVMIEDYLKLRPDHENILKKYIKEKRIIIGPWYSQPDEFTPSGESLIRNLLIGINMAKEYGDYMKVGYLPDAFGHNGQLPHILKGFNIDSACIMRGVPIDKLTAPEFKWHAINGDSVLAVSLPKGYSNGMFLPNDMTHIDHRINEAVNDLKKVGSKDHFLIMDGVDHQFPESNVADYIKQKPNNYTHSTLEKYIEGINQINLDELTGELTSPVTNRVHLSMASTRMLQKQKNRVSERLLTHYTEPASTLAWLFGAPYKKELINNAWKILMQNQIHDSICGCCTDDVHKEIDQRYLDISQIGETIYKTNSRAIARRVSSESLSITVFNDSFVKGKRIVEAKIYTDSKDFSLEDKEGNTISYLLESQRQVDAAGLSIWSLYMDTPCIVFETVISFVLDFSYNFGYQTFKIIEKSLKGISTYQKGNEVVENEYYNVTINQNGTLNILDKQTGSRWDNLGLFEDIGDAGDTYNFSPLSIHEKITSKNSVYKTLNIRTSNVKSIIEVSLTLEVPSNLEETVRSKIMKPLDIDITCTLYNHTKRIDMKFKVNNQAKDHRLRVLFPTNIRSKMSYAEIQNGIIERHNELNETSTWKELGYKEQPLPIYPMQRFVYLKDKKSVFAVLNKDLTEYEIYNNDTIAITLFRSVGYMGKSDLSVRPGRSSGIPIETPNAQEQGIHESSCSLFFGIDLDNSIITNEAAKYNVVSRGIQNEIPLTNLKNKLGSYLDVYQIKTLQSQVEKQLNVAKFSRSVIELSTEKLLITSIKKAENSNRIVFRIYNPNNYDVSNVLIQSGIDITSIYLGNMLEEITEELEVRDKSFIIPNVKALTTITVLI